MGNLHRHRMQILSYISYAFDTDYPFLYLQSLLLLTLALDLVFFI